MSLSAGAKIGPYEIVESIGRGGMGEVYRAHDSRLGRDVAIKTSTEHFGERVEREARAIAAMNHPNICQIYDVGPDHLVMELIGGETLGQRIRRGAIPLHEAMRLADQIAEALAAAHEKSITHRDLKPENIKIDDSGNVKVLDFGLARIGPASVGGVDSSHSPTLAMSLTQPGVILGTAAYMSPEQARGKPADSRSDIWAFGVVLYEMLTARRLFRGEDLTETLASIVKETPDLSAVPHEVRRLIEACLQKDPRRRLQAIGDRHLLLSQPERTSTGWGWPITAGLLALGVASLAWIHVRETTPVPQTLRYQLTRSGEAGFAHFELSPDGRHIAFTARSGATNRLYVRTLDSFQDREIPGTDGATYPFWSPDSAHIAFFSRGKLRQVALAGGPATVLSDAPDGRGGAWGADDTIIFTPTATGTISRVQATGGTVMPLELPRPGAGPRDSLRFPQFLPDGTHFLYTIEAATREGEGVYMGSLAGGAPVRVLPDLSITRFAPSPGSTTRGHLLFRRDKTLLAQPFDTAKAQTTGDPFPLTDTVLNSGNTGFADVSFAANGTLVFAAGTGMNPEREVVWLDRSGKRGTSILKQEGITDFALSPDRTQLLYSLATQMVTGDLWLRDVARGTSQRFTLGPFSAFTPVWAPTGGSVAFTVFPEDRIYRKASASAKEEPLPVSGTNTYVSSWSSDGKLMAFSQTGTTSQDDLWLLSLDGDRKPTLFRQTPYSEANGQISPDGRWLAYHSDASGRNEVYVEPITPGGVQRQISVDGATSPRWRDDGRELYFVSGNNTMMAVDVRSGPELTFGAPRALFREPNLLVSMRSPSFQPSPDGRQFLTLLRTGGASTVLPLTVVTNWQHAYGR